MCQHQGRETIQAYVEKMWPRAIQSFGAAHSANEKAYMECGLKTRTNAMCQQLFIDLIKEDFKELGLTVPTT